MGHYIDDLNSETISTIYKYVSNITSPHTEVKLARLGGEIYNIGENDTAFSYRNSKYAMVIQTRWKTIEESSKHLKWTKYSFSDMKSHSNGKVYLNFITNEGEKRVKDAYNETTFRRLRRIKTKYDTDNFFCMNQNIKPL